MYVLIHRVTKEEVKEMHPSAKEFYEEWANKHLENPERIPILKWKAVNLANLFLRTLGDQHVDSICEIGGAEGTVLNTIGVLLGVDRLVNYDLSSSFCQFGEKKYPHIRFVNKEFPSQEGEMYDLIICSDIIEHVIDQDNFLESISHCCRYALFKIPIEKCLTDTNLMYRLRGHSKPRRLIYGPEHYNGHLRGYTIHQAKMIVARYFQVLDISVSHVAYFSGGPRQQLFGRHLGTHMTTWMFGGALFALGARKPVSLRRA